MKILLTDCATVRYKNDVSLECFKDFGEVDEYEHISREELLKIIPDYDAVICNKTIIDATVISAAKNLKYIGLFATGYNNIDTVAARKKGIIVCNAADYSTEAVAQHTFSYILSHYTRLSDYDNFVKNGGWKESKIFSPISFPTDEVMGKTIGIIGYGSIGKAVERIALAFRMNVLVYTRTPREDKKFVDLDYLLQHSDIVTLHCPLNEQSRGMMNKEAFSKMKKGSFFINTSRGGTIEEQALFDALSSGHLSGAGIDVLNEEPMSKDCVLFNAPSIIITPHTAWAPVTTRKRLVDTVCLNLSGFIKGEIKNRVN